MQLRKPVLIASFISCVILLLLGILFGVPVNESFWVYAQTQSSTSTPSPTPQPTPNVTPLLISENDIEIRVGPGEEYELLGYLPSQAQAEIVGRNQDGNWWQIKVSLGNEGRGWTKNITDTIKISGIDNVPIALPPTPTTTPSPTSSSPSSTATPIIIIITPDISGIQETANLPIFPTTIEKIFSCLADSGCLVQFLNLNPIWLFVFFVSLIANIIQISQAITARTNLREERKEKEKLRRWLDTYDSILNLEGIKDRSKEELEQVEQEISKKSNLAEEISERINLLETSAKKELISHAIETNTDRLVQAYDEITRLRKEQESLGDLPPHIPSEKLQEIEKEIQSVIKPPYDLPKSFLQKSILLVLIILLLPWPVDTLIILMFISVFLRLVFEAVTIYSDDSDLVEWMRANASFIGWVTTIAVWYSGINVIQSLMPYPFRDIIFGNGELIKIPLVIFIGSVQWFTIRNYVLSPLRDLNKQDQPKY